MRAELRLMMAVVVLVLLAGGVSGAVAVVTFDKNIAIPERTFTWENQSYKITHAGNYKLNEPITVTISSGTDTMLITLWDADKLTVWSKTPDLGQTSVTIPAGKVTESGTYGIVVSSEGNTIGIAPLVVSEYYLIVTPTPTQTSPGSTIKVKVNVYNIAGNLESVPPGNSVKVEFVKGTSTQFNGIAVATANTGVYEANLSIPSSASGNYQLYAAITTNKNIYQDYPETIGAASYSGTITITQASSTSSQSGGGGGGGGGPSGENYSNILVKENYDLFIAKDIITTYAFTNKSNPVEFVNITGNTSAGIINVAVEALKNTSTLVKTPAPGITYKNANIWVGTTGFAVPKNIKEATIVFRVENSWLGSNSLAGSDVKLLHWDGSQWTPLETAQTTKDDTYTYYEAKTNAFSPFAIVGLKQSGTVVQPTAQQPQSEVTAVATNTPAETSQQDTTGIFGITYPIFVLIIALLTGILIVVPLWILARKKR
ncbi:MAG: PGF-pre-PGF domain-containing protein [Candidatus Methanoperedens sp.]|nr:PGF-pre-PGF domain-containing protein [Candidatus Methanoperedens sp.]